MFGPTGMEALAKLLAPPKDDDNTTSNNNSTYHSNRTNQSSQYHPFRQSSKPIPESEKHFPVSIASNRQISEPIVEHKEPEMDVIPPKLPEPKFTITYQQRLTAKDVAFVDPFSSDHCDSILIKLVLPNDDISSMDVKVKDDCITLVFQSKKYFLSTTLPEKVFRDNYNAKWIKDIQTLQITLQLQNDGINKYFGVKKQ